MFGYIYLTTNLTNGKKYIGRKKSDRFLGNAYCGSSSDLNHEVFINNLDKYNDLKVEVIQICESEKELHDQEMYWIKFYNAVEDPMFYNKHPGGNCRGSGWHHTDVYKSHMSEIQKDGGWMKGKHRSEETKQLMSKKYTGEGHPMYGKHHTEESKKLMREAKLKNLPKQCGSGKDNPMYGRIWVHRGSERKAINPDQYNEYKAIGFISNKLEREASNKTCATTIERIA